MTDDPELELRYCVCADPENCKETVPGYVCRKGTVRVDLPPVRVQGFDKLFTKLAEVLK